jgi:hypothetical protein
MLNQNRSQAMMSDYGHEKHLNFPNCKAENGRRNITDARFFTLTNWPASLGL